MAGALDLLAGLARTRGRYADAEALGRRALAIREKALGLGAKGLVWLKGTAGGGFDSPVAKFLSADESAAVVDRPR